MGGGNSSHSENLLVIVPFPEPTEILEKLQEKHPSLQTIRFVNTQFTDTPWTVTHEIPDGKPELSVILQYSQPFSVINTLTKKQWL